MSSWHWCKARVGHIGSHTAWGSEALHTEEALTSLEKAVSFHVLPGRDTCSYWRASEIPDVNKLKGPPILNVENDPVAFLQVWGWGGGSCLVN